MQPSPEEFKEWLQHPVSEWVMGCVQKFATEQKQRWSNLAWDGNLDAILLSEAKTRADCYQSLSQSSYEDWKAIDDSES